MKERIYSARIETVNKALELLRSRSASQAAKKCRKLSAPVDERAVSHCCSSKLHNSRVRKRKKVAASGFSRTLVVIEMRKCLMRHDWANIAELLPLLFEGRLEIEPLMWRYLITELFYSPKSTLETLNHFLQMCIGTESSKFLKRILTLPSQDEDTDSA